MTSLEIDYPHDDLPHGSRFGLEARVAVIALVLSIAGAGVTTIFSAAELKGRVTNNETQIADVRAEQDKAEARHQKTDELILEELRYLRMRVDEIATARRR